MNETVRSAVDRPQEALLARMRLAASCLVLVASAFVQEPGRLISDTKLDLVIAPGDFLARALHLWDPEGAFGQLQNQAYGYLWPLGPFFWLGHAIGLPGWIVQRLWLSVVLVAAFLGLVALARALGVRSQPALIVAGFAYALSPRMLTTLGAISIEAWPSAVAPWVLLPLVVGSERGSPRRAAALSALAIAMVGGVNAAATFAVIPLGVVWLLTRTRGPRRTSLMLWWPALTFLATCWWLVPLLAMGSYSPPFLDYIESAEVTTFPTTLFDAMRGTSDWIPYLDPGWRAGTDLIRTSYLILNTAVVVLLGALGLIRRDNPHRQYLFLGLLTGLLFVTAGHIGAVHGWFAGTEHAWLDGVLAPLRNVHKFDPILRLPLVLGLAFLLNGLSRSGREESVTAPVGHQSVSAARSSFVGVLVLAVVGVCGAASPVWSGRLGPTGSYHGVPEYWSQAAAWLSRHDNGSRALLVPASSFGDYVWGSPHDEPLQPLAKSPWAVRNAIPLAPPGNIRMLDAVESSLARGRASAGLAMYLRRAGVGFLVVRNDLRPGKGSLESVVVRATLDHTSGITKVASFGPLVGGKPWIDLRNGRAVVNYGWQDTQRAVEIYQVAGVSEAAATQMPVRVLGGPEDLLRLTGYGILSDQPTVLAVDGARTPSLTGPVILTDGLRNQQRSFARLHDAISATEPGGAPATGTAVRGDYEIAAGDRWKTTAELLGGRLRSSPSTSDAVTVGPVRPGQLPFAAFDGHVETEWVSAVAFEGRPWLEVRPRRPLDATEVRLTAGTSVKADQVLRLRTNNGSTRVLEIPPEATRFVRLPGGRISWIRLEAAGRAPNQQLDIAELAVAGLSLTRSLRMPTLPPSWDTPDVIFASADLQQGTSCVRLHGDVRCIPGRSFPGEEPFGLDRLVHLSYIAQYIPRIYTSAQPGEAFDRLMQRSQPINVSSSTVAVDAPVASATAAVDGDPGTTWIASLDDPRPTLRLNWLGRRRLSRLSVTLNPSAAARRPTLLALDYPGGSQEMRLDAKGNGRIRPIRTDRLALTVKEAEPASSLQFDGSASALGVGVSELRIPGFSLLPLRLPTTRTRYPCGTGPTLEVNGSSYQTAVVRSPRKLWFGARALARVCGERVVTMNGGDNRIRLRSSPYFRGQAVVFRRADTLQPRSSALGIRRPSPETIVGAVRGDATLLAVRENVNAGWVARRVGGTQLSPVTVDGWQQGWRWSGARGRFSMAFRPGRLYQAGLLAGAVALAVLVLLCWLTGRGGSRRASPASSGRDIRPSVFLPITAVIVGLLAGWMGLLLFAVSLAGLLLLGRYATEAVPIVLVTAVGISAGWYAVRSLGDGGWAGEQAGPQYMVVVALAALCLAAQPLLGQSLSRMLGRSTRR